jgi:ABC-type nitrate/sulfonate/bicarbonate transport system substrate-binding protein
MNQTHIRVGGVPEHFNTPWYILKETQPLQSDGVTVDFIPQPGGTGQMIQGLTQGDLDMAVLLTEGVTAAIVKGAPLKIIRFYVDSPLIWGLHVHSNRLLDTPNKTEDKRFAISRPFSGSHLMAYIHADGLNQKLNDKNFVVIHDLKGAQKALAKAEADFFLWEKYTTQPLVDSGDFKRIAEVPTPWPCFVIAVREEFLHRNEDAVARLLSGMEETVRQLEANPEETVSHISERFNLKRDRVSDWFSKLKWTKHPELDEAVFLRVISALKRIGVLDNNLAAKPDAFLRELRQSNSCFP